MVASFLAVLRGGGGAAGGDCSFVISFCFFVRLAGEVWAGAGGSSGFGSL